MMQNEDSVDTTTTGVAATTQTSDHHHSSSSGSASEVASHPSTTTITHKKHRCQQEGMHIQDKGQQELDSSSTSTTTSTFKGNALTFITPEKEQTQGEDDDESNRTVKASLSTNLHKVAPSAPVCRTISSEEASQVEMPNTKATRTKTSKEQQQPAGSYHEYDIHYRHHGWSRMDLSEALNLYNDSYQKCHNTFKGFNNSNTQDNNPSLLSFCEPAPWLPSLPGMRIKETGMDIPLPLVQTQAQLLADLPPYQPFQATATSSILFSTTTTCDTVARHFLDPNSIEFTNPMWHEGIQQLISHVSSSSTYGIHPDLVSSKLDFICLEQEQKHQESHPTYLSNSKTTTSSSSSSNNNSKSRCHFATLLIQLPSICTGGSIVNKINKSENNKNNSKMTKETIECTHPTQTSSVSMERYCRPSSTTASSTNSAAFGCHYFCIEKPYRNDPFQQNKNNEMKNPEQKTPKNDKDSLSYEIMPIMSGNRILLHYSLYMTLENTSLPRLEQLPTNSMSSFSQQALSIVLNGLSESDSLFVLPLEESTYSISMFEEMGIDALQGMDLIRYQALDLAGCKTRTIPHDDKDHDNVKSRRRQQQSWTCFVTQLNCTSTEFGFGSPSTSSDTTYTSTNSCSLGINDTDHMNNTDESSWEVVRRTYFDPEIVRVFRTNGYDVSLLAHGLNQLVSFQSVHDSRQQNHIYSNNNNDGDEKSKSSYKKSCGGHVLNILQHSQFTQQLEKDEQSNHHHHPDSTAVDEYQDDNNEEQVRNRLFQWKNIQTRPIRYDGNQGGSGGGATRESTHESYALVFHRSTQTWTNLIFEKVLNDSKSFSSVIALIQKGNTELFNHLLNYIRQKLQSTKPRLRPILSQFHCASLFKQIHLRQTSSQALVEQFQLLLEALHVPSSTTPSQHSIAIPTPELADAIFAFCKAHPMTKVFDSVNIYLQRLLQAPPPNTALDLVYQVDFLLSVQSFKCDLEGNQQRNEESSIALDEHLERFWNQSPRPQPYDWALTTPSWNQVPIASQSKASRKDPFDRFVHATERLLQRHGWNCVQDVVDVCVLCLRNRKSGIMNDGAATDTYRSPQSLPPLDHLVRCVHYLSRLQPSLPRRIVMSDATRLRHGASNQQNPSLWQDWLDSVVQDFGPALIEASRNSSSALLSQATHHRGFATVGSFERNSTHGTDKEGWCRLSTTDKRNLLYLFVERGTTAECEIILQWASSALSAASNSSPTNGSSATSSLQHRVISSYHRRSPPPPPRKNQVAESVWDFMQELEKVWMRVPSPRDPATMHSFVGRLRERAQHVRITQLEQHYQDLQSHIQQGEPAFSWCLDTVEETPCSALTAFLRSPRSGPERIWIEGGINMARQLAQYRQRGYMIKVVDKQHHDQHHDPRGPPHHPNSSSALPNAARSGSSSIVEGPVAIIVQKNRSHHLDRLAEFEREKERLVDCAREIQRLGGSTLLGLPGLSSPTMGESSFFTVPETSDSTPETLSSTTITAPTSSTSSTSMLRSSNRIMMEPPPAKKLRSSPPSFEPPRGS